MNRGNESKPNERSGWFIEPYQQTIIRVPPTADNFACRLRNPLRVCGRTWCDLLPLPSGAPREASLHVSAPSRSPPSRPPSQDTAGLGGLVKTPSLLASRAPPPQSLRDTRVRLRLLINRAGSPSPRGSLRLLLFGVRGDNAAGAASHPSSVTSWLRTTAPLLKPTSVRGREVSGLAVAPPRRRSDRTALAAVLRRASRCWQADPSGRSDHGSWQECTAGREGAIDWKQEQTADRDLARKHIGMCLRVH